MSNHYFQFKQFTIQQESCAMKVSTDACIFGAWVPLPGTVQHVLDIGTGTGLLSLMLAQRNAQLYIDAVELDAAAATQAKENVVASPWQNRINIIQADVRQFSFQKLYDMVICNPPFFNNSLLGNDAQRNNVRHTLSLTYADLFAIIKKVLKPEGVAAILLPAAEHEVWQQLVLTNGWTFTNILEVRPKEGMSHNRVVSLCTSMQVADTKTSSLQIYRQGGAYTEEFTALLHPFYLNL